MPATYLALTFGSGKSFHSSFSNHFSFELGEARKEIKHELLARVVRIFLEVEVILDADEAASARYYFFDVVDEFLDAARPTIDAGDYYGVVFSYTKVLQDIFLEGAGLAGCHFLLDKRGIDVVAFAVVLQDEFLILAVQVIPANSGVANCFHKITLHEGHSQLSSCGL